MYRVRWTSQSTLGLHFTPPPSQQLMYPVCWTSQSALGLHFTPPPIPTAHVSSLLDLSKRFRPTLHPPPHPNSSCIQSVGPLKAL